MATKKMGFEGQLYIGTPGSTAATRLDNATDITITGEVDEGDTTVRGDSSVPPIETTSVTKRKRSFQWTMVHDTADTALETLRVAEAAGAAVALRMKDKVAGKGFDGDVIISITHGLPLNGEQTLQITAKPNADYGRVPQLYV